MGARINACNPPLPHRASCAQRSPPPPPSLSRPFADGLTQTQQPYAILSSQSVALYFFVAPARRRGEPPQFEEEILSVDEFVHHWRVFLRLRQMRTFATFRFHRIMQRWHALCRRHWWKRAQGRFQVSGRKTGLRVATFISRLNRVVRHGLVPSSSSMADAS